MAGSSPATVSRCAREAGLGRADCPAQQRRAIHHGGPLHLHPGCGTTVLRYSAAPTTITANGYVFAAGPKFERSKTKVVIGTQVDELDIKIYPETTDLVGSTPFLEAAWQGQLDGALLQLERAFMGAAAGGYGDTSAGTVILFSGRISDIGCSRSGIEMKCRSHLELLNIQMPRRLWQSSCTHVFGDAMCLFNRSSLAATFSAGGA